MMNWRLGLFFEDIPLSVGMGKPRYLRLPVLSGIDWSYCISLNQNSIRNAIKHKPQNTLVIDQSTRKEHSKQTHLTHLPVIRALSLPAINMPLIISQIIKSFNLVHKTLSTKHQRPTRSRISWQSQRIVGGNFLPLAAPQKRKHANMTITIVCLQHLMEKWWMNVFDFA